MAKEDFILNAGIKINAEQASNEVKQFVEDVKNSFQDVKGIDAIKKKMQELGASAIKNGKHISAFYKEMGNQRVRFNLTNKGRLELGKDKVVYEDITKQVKEKQALDKEISKQVSKQELAYKNISDKIFLMTAELKAGVYTVRDFNRITQNIKKLNLGLGSLTQEDAAKAKNELGQLSDLLDEQKEKFRGLSEQIREAMRAAGNGPIEELSERLKDIKSLCS